MPMSHPARGDGRVSKGNTVSTSPSQFEDLLTRLGARDATLGIVGLGYVGLPLALAGLDAGFRVIGFDVNARRVNAIAVSSNKRDPALPNVPTMIEQGFDVDVESWQGLLVPSATPRDAIVMLQNALQKALASPEFRKGLERLGAEPIDERPAAFEAFLRNELEKYRRLAKRVK